MRKGCAPRQDHQPTQLGSVSCMQTCVNHVSKACMYMHLQPHAHMCRPEMRFSGIDELIARIKSDVGISKAQLDMPEHAQVRQHVLFTRHP